MLGTSVTELLGRRISEIFPVNPDDQRAATRLETASRRMLDTGWVVSG